MVQKSEPGKYTLMKYLSVQQGSSINVGIDRDMCAVQYGTINLM